MRAKYIKRREAFEKQAHAVLLRVGAIEVPSDVSRVPWPEFTLETKAGTLGLSFHTSLYFAHEPWFRGGGAPWVAARFKDVEAAKQLPLIDGELNPFSGKWNHHYWHSWTEDFTSGLEHLERRLRAVLPSVPEGRAA